MQAPKQTPPRTKEYYAIRGKPLFTGFSFTIAARKNLKRRDIRRLIGRWLNSEVNHPVKCLIASDAANCNAWHAILDTELTEKQALSLSNCVEQYRLTHKLGGEFIFYKPEIRGDAQRYITAHRYLDILEVK